ncbi:MAG: exodeoxyribonuclease V subunit beta [Desulfobacteraceae bacterium]
MDKPDTEFTGFDPAGVKLSGPNLVEAGAGTGKTFSLALLYLRGVLELEADVDGILAVTFTNAAVAELKDRIRSFMDQAIFVISHGESAEAEPLIAEIVKNAMETRDPGIVKLILKKALYSLDEAHVYTIHGFCRRVLDEYAFLTKAGFDTEVITDDFEYMQEAAEDYYRTRIDIHPPAMLSLLKKDMGLTPDRLLSHASRLLNKPGLSIYADDAEVADLDNAWKKVGALFRKNGGEAADLLRESEKLKRNKENFKHENLETYISMLSESIESDMPDMRLLHRFSASNVQDQTLAKFAKHGDFPGHELFDACLDFVDLFSRVRGKVIKESVEYIKQRTRIKKEMLNQKSFSDLLEDVHQAVSENGFENSLTRALRKKYRLGFIDEFQDTDQFQWEIIKSVFVNGGIPLFLIGDPKQAVYSFRGADVFSYIRAKEEVPDIRKYRLETNYRSSDRFVRAVNEVFSSGSFGRSPFLLDKIEYNPVLSASSAKAENMQVTESGKEDGCSFVIWKEDTVTAKSNFEGRVETAVANEITEILQPGAFVIREKGEHRDLDPKDIAVLVLTHEQGRAVKNVLDRMNIPSVISRSGSVFDTPEAVDLFRLLTACHGSVDRDLMLGTLVSGIGGMDEEYLCMISEAEFERHLERFRFYSRIWREKGVAAMTAAFFHDYGVYERFLRSVSGERRLTNLRHLVDLLNTREKQSRATCGELVSWFSLRTSSAENERQEYEMTLESDESAVKIVTVHASKGLEYPVVFAPYFYSGVPGAGKDVNSGAVFHSDDNRLVLDMRPENSKEANDRHLHETFAEKLRLFYVAVTRAAYRCYTFLPAGFRNKETVPAHHFLEKFLQPDRDTASGCIRIRELPSSSLPEAGIRSEDEQPPFGDKRSFNGRVNTGTTVSSYSSIVRQTEYTAFEPSPKEDIIGFFRGAHAGNALHDIFETLDFQSPGTWKSTVLSVLSDYNLAGPDNLWVNPVADCVENVMNTQYSPLSGDPADVFRLSDVPARKRTAELEFYLKCRSVRRQPFMDLLGETAGDIRPSELSGWLHGYIDLVFENSDKYYIVDWKSNYLGPDVSDYTADGLAQVMEEHNYLLQAYIYTLAFHRHLDRRLGNYSYEKHFGGVFYLFLRGFTNPWDMTVGDTEGIYFIRPDTSLVHRLSHLVTGW